jgi:glycosyltransferase involved in cell wall biosynthesis
MSPSVLHVLPHPGGGGERYVDSLLEMPGYRFERVYLAHSREPLPALPKLATSVPHVNLSAARFEIIHVHGEIPSLLCLPALARRPSVVTLHGLSFVRRSSGVRAKIAAASLRLVVGAATKTICVSQAERTEILEVVGESSSGRLELAPLGVESPNRIRQDERSAARSALGIRDQLVVAMVGVLEYPKDPVTAARAVVEVAKSGIPITLFVVGDGRLRAEVEAVAREAEAAVRLLGHREDVQQVLAAADAVMLSSRHEGLPYALLDAMAAGLPTIVTDYPGAHEAVGDAGLVVPFGDVHCLAEAVRQLADDPGKRGRLGEIARARAEEAFSLDAMLERTRRIYCEILRDQADGQSRPTARAT